MYEFLVPTHEQTHAEVLSEFNRLGAQGWEFCGIDFIGRNVFKRSVS